MEDFTNKFVIKKDDIRISIEITYEKGRLSIIGMGKDFGGQCQDTVLEYFPEQYELVEIWNRWHLNDMRAGDPVQEGWLRINGHGKDYNETCDKLEKAGLLTHNGYKYGTAWKSEPVPVDILKKLKEWK